jgi:hypothetical protein
MFDRRVTMSFEIDKRTLTHLKDISSYNHNYYHIELGSYGDYILPEKCDIIYEECADYDDSGAYYSLGWFEGSKFIAAWTWYERECLDLDIEIEGFKKID